MKEQEANAKIEAVQKMLTADQVDALVSEGDPTFRAVAEATLAWNALLLQSGIVKRHGQAPEIMAAAYVMLAIIVKYAYALGVRRGQQDRPLKAKRRK